MNLPDNTNKIQNQTEITQNLLTKQFTETLKKPAL